MTPGPEGWLDHLRHAGAGHDPTAVLATVARHLAAAVGSPAVEDAVDRRWPVGLALRSAALPPAGEAEADALGWAYEALARPEQRRRGLHYTPRSIAERLAALAMDDGDDDVPPGGLTSWAPALDDPSVDDPSVANPARGRGEPTRGAGLVVCDPACGGGAFLLAIARRLTAAGLAPRAVVDSCVVGIDLDPVAVAVATTALQLWCGDAEAVPLVATADALTDEAWPHRPPGGFDVVLGNPPFQSQLGSATARAGDELARLRRALGEGVSGYVDTAALFLLAAVQQVRPGGRVVLIQPQSVLATRDAAPLRRRLDLVAPLEGLWVCDEPVFAAATRVCAPVLRLELAPDSSGRTTESGASSDLRGPLTVRRWYGTDLTPAAPSERPAPGEWAALAVDLRGIPPLASPGPSLVEVAGATAGFRDEFYGLVPHVREATGSVDERPLVTSGLIDPAMCAWGRREVRFAKRRWQRPVVDLAGLAAADPRLSRWVGDRLVPKVLVATQTRVVEVAVDADGRWVPSTPVIAVPVDPERLWHVAAALSAPPVTAWALRLSAGTALVPDALKLSATQVRQVPGPVDHRAWDEGADRLRAAQQSDEPDERWEALLAMGVAMVAAYRVDDGVAMLAWWVGRLRRPGGTGRSDIRGAGR